MNQEKIIHCDCGAEMLVINHEEEGGYNIAMFTAQYDRYSLWQRLRHIWRILWYGRPYTDQICLNYEKAKDLADFINQTYASTIKKLEKENKIYIIPSGENND